MDLTESIKNASYETLWTLFTDLSVIYNACEYGKKQEMRNSAFMFWYQLSKALENEIDKRLKSMYDGDDFDTDPDEF